MLVLFSRLVLFLICVVLDASRRFNSQYQQVFVSPRGLFFLLLLLFYFFVDGRGGLSAVEWNGCRTPASRTGRPIGTTDHFHRCCVAAGRGGGGCMLPWNARCSMYVCSQFCFPSVEIFESVGVEIGFCLRAIDFFFVERRGGVVFQDCCFKIDPQTTFIRGVNHPAVGKTSYTLDFPGQSKVSNAIFNWNLPTPYFGKLSQGVPWPLATQPPSYTLFGRSSIFFSAKIRGFVREQGVHPKNMPDLLEVCCADAP